MRILGVKKFKDIEYTFKDCTSDDTSTVITGGTGSMNDTVVFRDSNSGASFVNGDMDKTTFEIKLWEKDVHLTRYQGSCSCFCPTLYSKINLQNTTSVTKFGICLYSPRSTFESFYVVLC